MTGSTMQLTYTAMLPDGNGKRVTHVRFEDQGSGGKRTAEGVVPGGTITKSEGFSKEELEQLSEYLIANENEILNKAREISNPLKWL